MSNLLAQLVRTLEYLIARTRTREYFFFNETGNLTYLKLSAVLFEFLLKVPQTTDA